VHVDGRPIRRPSTCTGSVASASRCISTPTWRCSRTACWAAAIERGRPSVSGSTTPGNSTMSRTGTMIIASGGRGGRDRAARPAISSADAKA